jgi:hypothetical protein
MDWNNFESNLMLTHMHTIDNNSNKNIVLFGSCHIATIGFMLNKLLNYEYNIHIIISWFFQNKGIENFNMNNVNEKIMNVVSICDVFIYHNHINDYHVNAVNLHFCVKQNCIKLVLPNYRLDYTNEKYALSLSILSNQIMTSSFPEFNFIIDNHKNILFFNTTNHPTHFLLFLQSESIQNKILKNGNIIDINNYFDPNNRKYFKQFNDYVLLPGKEPITHEIQSNTGININGDYFD